jgi:phage portal protein BeeE
MGIFDMFRAAKTTAPAERVEPPVVASASPVQSESQWKGFVTGGVSRSGARVNETTALSIPATLQALRILTGVFAMTPLHYYEKTERGRMAADSETEGQLFTLAPNSHQTPFAFMEILLADVLLSGNFYAFRSRDRLGLLIFT